MKTVLVILLCVLVLLQVRLWTGPGSLADIVRLESAIAEQDAANAALAERNAVLMDDVSDLRNGLDSIEERARNELGLIRQGETFYLIVENEPNEPLPETVEEENPYLEMFRDEADSAPGQASTTQDPVTGTAAQ